MGVDHRGFSIWILRDPSVSRHVSMHYRQERNLDVQVRTHQWDKRGEEEVKSSLLML